MLNSLQASRAFAAVFVVLFHLDTTIFGNSSYWPEPLWRGFAAGHSGVHFFFVLSGFIMMWIHRSDVGDQDALRSFAYKRLMRIYPVYWVVLAMVIPIYFLAPSAGEGYETHPFNIFTSLILWPTNEYPILAVAWTLRHEVLFYFLFGLIIYSRIIGTLAILMWVVGCAVAVMTSPLEFPLSFIFSPINLLFSMGMAVAVIARNAQRAPPWLIALMGIILFSLTGTANVTLAAAPPFTDLGYGLGASMLVLGIVRLEQSASLKVPNILVELGNASYAIYLVHYPALSALSKIWFKLGLQNVPPLLAFVSLFFFSVLAGWIFHRLIEKPLMHATRRFFLNRSVSADV